MTRSFETRCAALLLGLASCTRRVEPPGAEVALPVGSHVRFVAVGDTGESNDGLARVAATMAKTCAARGCDFALLLGDNVYPDGPTGPDDPALELAITRPFAQLGVPVFGAIGNHDDGGSGWSPERGDAEISWTRRPAWWRTPGRHYRVAMGDVDLIVLDTDAILFGRDRVQRADVARWLGTSHARWKIVAGHHPYQSNGKHGDAGRYDGLPSLVPVASGRRLRRFVDDVVCGKADLYLAGHDHAREWMTETCRGTELVVSGAGSLPKPLVSSRSARFASGELGFFYGDAGAGVLSGDFLGVSGSTDFARTVPKR